MSGTVVHLGDSVALWLIDLDPHAKHLSHQQMTLNGDIQCWTAGSAAHTAWVNAGSFCSRVVAVN